MEHDYQDPGEHKDPINVPISEGLRMGFRRPRFREEASRKFTAFVFLFIAGILVAAVLLNHR